MVSANLYFSQQILTKKKVAKKLAKIKVAREQLQNKIYQCKKNIIIIKKKVLHYAIQKEIFARTFNIQIKLFNNCLTG